jgi:DsbC/DsbD-like thiol-disulfide interchange protein
MKKITFLLIALVISVFSAMAQNPIKWRTTYKMTSATEGVLTVKAIVTDGWHLYGTKLPDGGPKATVLDFSESKGIKFTTNFKPSVKATEKMDEMFGLKLTYWGSNVSFTRKFKLTGNKADAVINGKISYMACNDENCMPPKTESVTLNIK